MEQYVFSTELPIPHQNIGIACEITMREHRALGPSGRAGSVDDDSHVVGRGRGHIKPRGSGFERLTETAAAVGIEGEKTRPDAMLSRERDKSRMAGGTGDS